MESLKELYRVGPGPSSSHTLAVRNACLYYLDKYPNAKLYEVTLYGSLSLTGKGHMSDKIIKDTFNEKKVEVIFNDSQYDDHPNTLKFKADNDNEMIIYSTGGGAIEVKGIKNIVDDNVYSLNCLKDINEYCANKNIDYVTYVYESEDIKDYLIFVAKQMIKEIDNGLKAHGDLPGPLGLKRVAYKLLKESQECDEASIKEKLTISAYAYSAMEENACGKTVVTAPTLGSCGVLSSVLKKYYDKGYSLEKLADGLAVAGLFGNLVKKNASISGARGGCQAEIGTACSMAAAFSSYMEGLTLKQIEIAAEIAMEHNLGLTCDPVGGYVQVPCIERNGVAALRSIDCMIYAKYLDPIKDSKVSFDMIVKAMNYTGQKIVRELKETSLGGLAEVVPINKDSSGC